MSVSFPNATNRAGFPRLFTIVLGRERYTLYSKSLSTGPHECKKLHYYVPFFSVVMYILSVSSLNVIISIAHSLIVFVSEPERLDTVERFVVVES